MNRDLTLPNGIAFAPDGKTLYVANSGPKMEVEQYPVEADGSLSAARHSSSSRTDPDQECSTG